MGYIRHNAIIVTSWDSKRLSRAIAKADELRLIHTEAMDSPINGYSSFMIVPDGSKEGWDSSNTGEAARAAWIKWAKESEEPIDWVHISYGGDEPQYTHIEDFNCNGDE